MITKEKAYEMLNEVNEHLYAVEGILTTVLVKGFESGVDATTSTCFEMIQKHLTALAKERATLKR